MTVPVDAPNRAQLLPIIAHARAGALDRAWAMFVALDSTTLDADPAALAVKGRLLKDMALRLEGTARRRLYADAADAYRTAATLAGTTYPLINAATLSLLCGEDRRARLLAQETLDRIAAHPEEPETPYYRAATGAEALLLLGREAEARAAMAEAMALAPRAWEDHASTLRQFAIVLEAQQRDAGWLDALRPPRSLHFGGHMAFRADSARGALDRKIAALLEAERIGFGYGALAAGADIIVAEALLDRGAALHAILPGGVQGFTAVSVDPWGPAWRARFETVLAGAETVRTIEPIGRPDDAMIALADEIAMGSALLNARLLASEGIQLLVLPETSEAASESASVRSRVVWSGGGRRQHILRAAREDIAAAESDAPPPPPRRRAAALAIRVEGREESLAERLALIKAALDSGPAPAMPPSFTGDAVVLGFDDVARAGAMAAILAGCGLRVGGHYGIAESVVDPFARALRLVGRTVELAGAASASAPPGTVCATEDFAAALTIAADMFRAEYVGELATPAASPVGLFALKRQS